jgi:hypothetical protein
MLEAGAFLVALPIVSPEARSPHFVYAALALVASVYASVEALSSASTPRRDPRARLADAWRASSGPVRTALVLLVLGAVLLNTSPPTFLGRGAVSRFLAAACAPGWGALCVLGATLLLLRRERRAETPPAAP